MTLRQAGPAAARRDCIVFVRGAPAAAAAAPRA